MSDSPRLYIAGMGMITPVGANTAMTAAAVRAGISAYAETDYTDLNGLPITMASVPDIVLDELEADIGEGDVYDACHFRVIKMAIIALREAVAKQSAHEPVPFLLAMPEVTTTGEQEDTDSLVPLYKTLEQNCKPWISTSKSRSIYSGRAAGMVAINYAFRYLYESQDNFVLVGGSDSHKDIYRLNQLSEDNRLLVRGSPDSFVPGEAACFLLLTRYPELAFNQNGSIVALHPPGIADETGHFGNDEPYRGEGLDQAFKKALNDHKHGEINSIYCSMNGENHWAKEYGVAYMRNKSAFLDSVNIQHPADIFGDTGAATSALLIGLAAMNLFNNPVAKRHLVYSSSDTAKRGAIVLEKIAMHQRTGQTSTNQNHNASMGVS